MSSYFRFPAAWSSAAEAERRSESMIRRPKLVPDSSHQRPHMNPLWLVGVYVNRQKDELLDQLWARNAVVPDRAVDLSTFPVKPSILRDMLNRKIVHRTSSGRFYLDPTRRHRAYGASGKFTLYAIGIMVLCIVVIALL